MNLEEHLKENLLENEPTKQAEEEAVAKEENAWYKIDNCVAFFVAIIAIFALTLASIKEYQSYVNDAGIHEKTPVEKHDRKTYWVHGRNVESGYLKNVFLILDTLGYENNPITTNWDLLWAHDYPFRALYPQLKNLRPHQKVNKLPGSGYITNKVDLVTSGLEYIPPAFRLPRDKAKLLRFAETNASLTFVQKSNDHRNIHIRTLDEIDLDVEGTFVQEFVDRPLLVSGYKFDIGIYTIITSVDPLRIYIYNGDALLRFCPVKYYPFDPNNIDKYVVGDDYLPTWEVPALKHSYQTLGFGMKESLNEYIRTQGKDPSIIWEQIENSIRLVALAKEPQIIDVVNRFASKSNFFEMMRFDFVVNEDLKVYLMEANMSPNLSSAHFPPNRLLFEQVIYNLFGLVGIGERLHKDTLATRTLTEEQMQVSDKNIVVYPAQCNSPLCRSSCMSPICQLCKPCLSDKMKENLRQAYLEHVNKGDCKRIFPVPMIRDEKHVDIEVLSAENQLQHRWFQGKCNLDSSWCM